MGSEQWVHLNVTHHTHMTHKLEATASLDCIYQLFGTLFEPILDFYLKINFLID